MSGRSAARKKSKLVSRAPDAITVEELVPIANRMRGALMHLKALVGRVPATHEPLSVFEAVIDQIDAWEEEVGDV